MLKQIIVLFMLCLAFSNTYAEDNRTPVNFELTVSKTTVNVGDPIALRLKVTNPTNRSVTYHVDDGYLANYIKVIDRAGRVMPWERLTMYDRPWDKITTHILKPYDSFTIYLQPLLKINNQDEFVLDFVHSQIVLKRPGEYTVVGYLNGYDLDKIYAKPEKDEQETDVQTAPEKGPLLYQGENFSNSFKINFLR